MNKSILIYFLFLKLAFILNYRVEPLQTFNSRKDMYEKNFYNFTDKLRISFSKDKGYFCIANKEISKNDNLFSIPRNYSFSVFDDFPFKSNFLKVLQSTEKIYNNNLTSNILLTIRLMQDLKSNVTKNFLLFKTNLDVEDIEINFKEEFNFYKQYLHKKTKFAINFLNNLPFASGLNQFSWSNEDVEEYSKTGFYPVFRKEISQIFEEIVHKISKIKSRFLSFTEYWLNNKQINIFLSIYSIVTSRTFTTSLLDYNVSNEKDRNYEDNLILSQTGGTVLIPFIDLCNHYHPNKEMFEENNNHTTKSFTIKRIKLSYDDEYIKIYSLHKYSEKEEFDFTYSQIFTNDFLLLNYGFIVKNNPFQEYVFKFEMDDPKRSFYERLNMINLTENSVHLTANNKLVVHIKLNSFVESNDLIKFIASYIKFQSEFEKKKLDSGSLLMFKLYALYINTLDRNINSVIPLRDIKYNITAELTENYNKIKRLNEIIDKNSKRNDNELESLLYFKTLHSYLKKDLIFKFNVENIKILIAQRKIVLDSIRKLALKNLVSLRWRYIKIN